MEEIEILYSVTDKSILKKLQQFEKIGVKQTLDIYYTHPKLKQFSTKRHWLRLRQKGKDAYLTYKEDHFKKKTWSHSTEEETHISSFTKTEHILKALGFRELIRINNRKHLFRTKKYEIAFEEVKELGLFVEVECLHPGKNVAKEKKDIRLFIQSLGIKGKECNMGKPEMLL